MSPAQPLHQGRLIPHFPGGTVRQKTGSWRIFRPVLDVEKCNNCLLCWIFCPDGAIDREEKWVTIGLDFCKGCGICENECPTDAITMVKEGK
ncbi:MAG: 4Fe-4S binding protein [Firmicutes bacterium]|nr:4Fe-4S binding protein [Bacillota bacterium]